MSTKIPTIEPEIQAILNASGLPKVSKITFIKIPKVIFTVDEFDSDLRLIYSQGFLDKIRK